MELLKINMHGQITIPSKIRKKLHCSFGDYLQVEIKENCMQLLPAKIINSSQEWFWTKEWQEKERESDKDLESKNYKKFNDMDFAIDHLKKV